MERSIHDALCVVKRVLESNLVVPGGGCVETALSIYLENFATSIVSQCVSSVGKTTFLERTILGNTNQCWSWQSVLVAKDSEVFLMCVCFYVLRHVWGAVGL